MPVSPVIVNTRLEIAEEPDLEQPGDSPEGRSYLGGEPAGVVGRQHRRVPRVLGAEAAGGRPPSGLEIERASAELGWIPTSSFAASCRDRSMTSQLFDSTKGKAHHTHWA